MIKHIITGALILAALIPMGVLAQDSPLDFRPSWKVGQTWVVAVNRSTFPVPVSTSQRNKPFKAKLIEHVYHFEVKGKERLDDDMCWCIEFRPENMVNPSDPLPIYYHAFFRESDCTLKCLRAIDVDRPELSRELSFFRGPVAASWEAGFLPLEFPLFKGDFVDIVPTRVKREDGTEYTPANKDISQVSCAILQGGNKNSSLQIKIKKNVFPVQSSLQIWEKGQPWWSEAIVDVDGKLELVATLVSVDGVEVHRTKSRMWKPKIINNKLGVETNETISMVTEASTNAVYEASASASSVAE